MSGDAYKTTIKAWPAEPGVPLNPDRCGYHWLRRKTGGLDPWYWSSDIGGDGVGGWEEEGGDGAPADFERAFTYHAPCIPPEAPDHG